MAKGKKHIIFFEVEVSHPCWFVDLTEKNPDVSLTTLRTVGIKGDSITNLVELKSPTPEKDVDFIKRHQLVKKVDVLLRKKEGYILKVTSSYKAMTFKVLDKSGATLLESPLTEEGKDKEILMAGSYKQLRNLIDEWKEQGDWEVKLTKKKHIETEKISLDIFKKSGFFDLTSAKQLLTDKQHEVFELACKYGYYDVPKKITLEELAAQIGISPPTIAEHLRKAEAKLFPALLKILKKA